MKCSRLRAWVERCLSPGYAYCGRCKRPWSFVDGHATPYAEGRGCFPLCESCWEQLAPVTRLPFYRILWDSWAKHGTEVPWAVVDAACLYERKPIEIDTLEEGMAIIKALPGLWDCVVGEVDHYQLRPTLPSQVREAWANPQQ